VAALLQVEGLSRSFGGIQALRRVSFSLDEGEIVGLIGPNGAGKTTLVNLVTGVHAPTEGRIVFAGTDITRQRPYQTARRGLARTFQIVQPFSQMTVVENVAAGALFAGADANFRRRLRRLGQPFESNTQRSMHGTGKDAATDRMS
jgi:branched-chain amino acid transport system ATP-binding protein